MEQLANLHEVLGESRYESEPHEVMLPVTFRELPTVEAAAREICERNGTDLSRFLRGCLRQLVTEYRS